MEEDHPSPTSKEQEHHKISLEDLPVEICIDILSWLPLPSLHRFKRVCRAWCDLAHNPRVLPSIYESFSNTSWLIIHSYEYQGCLHLVDPSNIPDENIVHVKDAVAGTAAPFAKTKCEIDHVLSCRGLLCIAYTEVGRDKSIHSRVCIHDPFTSEVKFLPECSAPMTGECIEDAYGFGFHPTSKEYIVTRLVNGVLPCEGYTRKIQTLEAFTLGKSEWRSIDMPQSQKMYEIVQSCQCLFDGTLYWLEERMGIPTHIHLFELVDGQFQTINGPEYRKYGRKFRLVVLGGRLSVAANDPYGIEGIDIWSMTGLGTEAYWTKQFTISRHSNSRDLWEFWPVAVLQNGDVVFAYRNRSLYSYDSKTNEFEEIFPAGLIRHRFQAISLDSNS